MEEKNRVVLSLGSNFNPEENIGCAAEKLRILFDTVCFSEAVYTAPIGDYPADRPFLNQVVIAYTRMSTAEELKALLKEIETTLGRNENSKAVGLIPIDIDLLQWNTTVLKPADMEREYILSGLLSLERKCDKGSQK